MTQAPAWWWSTAPRPGAIAVAHLAGDEAAVERVLAELCGRAAPARGEVAWRRFGAIDDGVVARVAPGHALVMPHAGPRIRALLDARMGELGAGAVPEGWSGDPYPEASDDLERRVLATLARAASPLAIDLLAAQPARWRATGWTPGHEGDPDARDLRLRRLVDPPRVAIVGPANAGKSTLLNALAGRTVAIAHDEPGTTRDAVCARIDLAGVVADVFDTPGVRERMDPVERAASELAARALAHADLVVELSAPGLGWAAPPRAADAAALRVLNQRDRPDAAGCGERASAAVAVSARTRDGLAGLVDAMREALVPRADLVDPRPWRFA
jgi:tRNA modification GTPase